MGLSLTLSTVSKSIELHTLNNIIITQTETREDNIIDFSANNVAKDPHSMSWINAVISAIIKVNETDRDQIHILIFRNIRKQDCRYHQNNVDD
jgi:hypothetical protein